jgi:hypothetical protein
LIKKWEVDQLLCGKKQNADYKSNQRVTQQIFELRRPDESPPKGYIASVVMRIDA